MHEMRRIAVVGSTGVGKTTLAREIARRAKRPHVELDALHWDANWTPAERSLFRERAEAAVRGDTWVTDGNYSAVRDIVWGRADTLVWLDYPLSIILRRLVQRTIRRVVSQEELWNGNRERLRDQLGRESLVFWALKTYEKRRREFLQALREPPYAHLTLVRLRSPQETDAWLNAQFLEAREPAGV